jgi:hypothetical protein
MLLVFGAYIALSIWGIMTMKQGLDYEKLLLKTDPLVNFNNFSMMYYLDLGEDGESRD